MNAERPLKIENIPSIVVEYQCFKEREGFVGAVGIIGGSEAGGIPYHRRTITEQLSIVQSKKGKFAVVYGGTVGCVPEMALDIGNGLGLPTFGVFPEDALTGKASFAIPVDSHPLSQVTWGVETAVLVSIADIFYPYWCR